MDMRTKFPFSMIVSGSRNVGKTEFVMKLLRHRHEMFDTDIDRLVWCYSKFQPSMVENFCQIFSIVEFPEGIPSDDYSNPKQVNLVVIDELAKQSIQSLTVSSYFTKGKHDNISVIFLTQNLFIQGKYARNISLNSDQIGIFKTPRDRSQISNLAKQIFPGNSNFLTAAYNDATKKPYSYIIYDTKQETRDDVKIRTGVFPGDVMYTYIIK